MGKRNIAYLSLGSNLGNRADILKQAVEALRKTGTVMRISSLHETEPWGKTDQPKFLNLAVKIKTHLEPLSFLREIQAIETALGRVRREKWGPRTIDIDILLWNDEVINHPLLQIPHPRMGEREFVLLPLREIAEDLSLNFFRLSP